MSGVDHLLKNYHDEADRMRRELADIEKVASRKRTELAVMEAKIAGVEEAAALLGSGRSRPKGGMEDKRRELSEVWKRILAISSEGGTKSFDYETLEGVAERLGEHKKRENLRSQMSLYRQRGLIDSEFGGGFVLTLAGRAAIGEQLRAAAELSSVPDRRSDDGDTRQAVHTGSGRGSSFDDDLDDDVPF